MARGLRFILKTEKFRKEMVLYLLAYLVLPTWLLAEPPPAFSDAEIKATSEYYSAEVQKISILETPAQRKKLGIPEDLQISVTVWFVLGPPGVIESYKILSMNYVEAPGLQLNPITRSKIAEKFNSAFSGKKLSPNKSLKQPLPRIKLYFRFTI